MIEAPKILRKLALPDFQYEFPCSKWTNFKIPVMSDDHLELLEVISKMPVEFKLMYDESIEHGKQPSSIFITYIGQTDIERFNYKVNKIELSIHLHLLETGRQRWTERLTDFMNSVKEVMDNQVPKKGKLNHIDYVVVGYDMKY